MDSIITLACLLLTCIISMYVVSRSHSSPSITDLIPNKSKQIVEDVAFNDFAQGEFEFLSAYDNDMHLRVHRLIDDFMRTYYESLDNETPLLYSNYYKQTHIMHKLEDLRKKLLSELGDSVFLMSEREYHFVHTMPKKINVIDAHLNDKIKLLCYRFGMRYDDSGVESSNMWSDTGLSFDS